MKFHVNSSLHSESTFVRLGTQADDKLVPIWLIMVSNENTMLTLVNACELVCSD